MTDAGPPDDPGGACGDMRVLQSVSSLQGSSAMQDAKSSADQYSRGEVLLSSQSPLLTGSGECTRLAADAHSTGNAAPCAAAKQVSEVVAGVEIDMDSPLVVLHHITQCCDDDEEDIVADDDGARVVNPNPLDAFQPTCDAESTPGADRTGSDAPIYFAEYAPTKTVLVATTLPFLAVTAGVIVATVADGERLYLGALLVVVVVWLALLYYMAGTWVLFFFDAERQLWLRRAHRVFPCVAESYCVAYSEVTVETRAEYEVVLHMPKESWPLGAFKVSRAVVGGEGEAEKWMRFMAPRCGGVRARYTAAAATVGAADPHAGS